MRLESQNLYFKRKPDYEEPPHQTVTESLIVSANSSTPKATKDRTSMLGGSLSTISKGLKKGGSAISSTLGTGYQKLQSLRPKVEPQKPASGNWFGAAESKYNPKPYEDLLKRQGYPQGSSWKELPNGTKVYSPDKRTRTKAPGKPIQKKLPL